MSPPTGRGDLSSARTRSCRTDSRGDAVAADRHLDLVAIGVAEKRPVQLAGVSGSIDQPSIRVRTSSDGVDICPRPHGDSKMGEIAHRRAGLWTFDQNENEILCEVAHPGDPCVLIGSLVDDLHVQMLAVKREGTFQVPTGECDMVEAGRVHELEARSILTYLYGDLGR
jgi:hypothetical protein